MKLSLMVNGTADSIEVLAPAPACRFRTGDGPERDAQVETPEPGVYSVLLDGRSYEARVEESPSGGVVVVIDGYRFEIEVSDPRRWTRKSGGRHGEGVQSIATPMPGKVVRVLVSPGDTVETGQGLVVVEAMKMQNELKASRAGRVIAVPAKEGATVVAGEVLATIE
ncbi:MAG: biotin/lipoyl-binding protein [Acidobacteriia bacterium]|nr:biotin/lipoyl-binding protein [Terriglobia bacterium]